MIAEIKFACSHCGQKIVVGSEAAGVEIGCPTCSNQVTIPEKSAVIEPRQKTAVSGEQLAAARAECERLNAKLSQAQTEIRNFQTERLALRAEVANLKQGVGTSEARVAALQADFELHSQRLAATETQLGEAERVLAEQRALVEQRAESLASVESELTGLRAQLAAARAETRAKVDALAESETSQAAVLQTAARLAQAEAELSAIREKFAANEKTCESLRALLDKDSAGRELALAKKRLAKVESDRAQLAQLTGRLEADLKAASEERDRNAASAAELRQQLAEARKQVEELSVGKMQETNDRLRALIARQNEELRQRFEDIVKYRKQKLTVKILWALTALGTVGLGYLAMQALSGIDWK